MDRALLALVASLLFASTSASADDLPDGPREPTRSIPAISLRDAIDSALHAHPRDREIVAELLIADAEVESARAESLPTLTLRYEHIWEDSHVYGPNGVHDPLDLDNVMVLSTIPLIDPRAWANLTEARERREVAEADAITQRRALALAAARAWIGVASATHALDVELESLRTARAHAEFVGGRLASGAAAQLDQVRADREVAVAAAHVEHAAAARTRAQELLGLLVGADRALDADVEADAPLADALDAGELEVPDVAAARRALEVARRETDNMYTSYLPKLDLELIGFFQTHPQPVLPVTGTGYAAFLRLTLPLYDPEREATLHERRAQQERAEAHLDDVTRTIDAERREGVSDVVRLRAALDETTRAADLARQALALTETRYANGAGTQLDVIYALRESRDADIAVTAAEDAWRRAALDLLAARGRLPTHEQLRSFH